MERTKYALRLQLRRYTLIQCIVKMGESLSYIVAYVKFPGAKKDYPTECLRVDIQIGDTVLVRRRDEVLRPATVTRVEYLDWDCGAVTLCKISEAELTSEGLKPPSCAPKAVGLTTLEAMRDYLTQRGWVPLKPKNKTYKVILTHSNQEETANIYLRRRGVDFQILPEVHTSKPKPFSYTDFSISNGRVVRHSLAKTTANLYEGVARFAESFENCERNYERFFIPVGSRNRRTGDLPPSNRDADEGFDAMLYEALGGNGGSVYIGDGLYMRADGGWHD